MASPGVELGEITERDVADVAAFFHTELNPRVPRAAWARLLVPPWSAGPNHGFLLRADGHVVGASAAAYPERVIAGDRVRICNLAAFCVVEEYRTHALRLPRAMLRQQGLEFTDLSPSGNVVALNERLGFERLNTATRLTVNLPRPAQREVAVTSDPEELARTLRGVDARVYADHRDAPASRHLLVTSGDSWAYLLFRRDRRKGLPLFATPLHLGGSQELVERAWPTIASRLLLKHGAIGTLAERRVLGFEPRGGIALASPRTKMFRSSRLESDQIDYLYSELTLLEW